jgi:Zn-dependent protease with chaperone function
MSQSSAKITHAEALLAPSDQFKREVIKSVIAIVGFIIAYIFLFVLSIGLISLCVYAGIALVVAKPSLYTLLFSLGIVACGIMIFVFLVKFLFSSSEADSGDSVEITQQEQPVLFDVIHKLAEQTGTVKPKKVFLSPDVNAAVFYNSSFWSMFFPVRKNLKIGLGLVNSVNVGELKAVIAHEFGHFSQRSMKVGSWVYQVNKIIYDMLFNNRGYANSLAKLANVHGILAFFVQVTVQVVKGIQWTLHQVFKMVNKTYMGLSRQMEFHADLVAASVCGSNNIVSALKRIEFADACFAVALDVCNTAWKDKKVVTNFYAHHRNVVSHMAGLEQFGLVDGLPVLDNEYESPTGNRVNYKDQWASHPTLQERKEYLESFDLTSAIDQTSAWALFENADAWKEKLTAQLYKNVPAEGNENPINTQEFDALFTTQLQAFSLPPEFKEFYNNRVVGFFDPEAVVQTPFVLQPFGQILTDEVTGLPKELQYLEQDIAVLQSIISNEIVTSSFDFDGQKYRRKDAATVLSQLTTEKETVQKRLDAADRLVFRYFYAVLPLPEAEKFKASYQHYFDRRRKADVFMETVGGMMNPLGPLFGGETMPVETIQSMIADLKDKNEPAFKTELNEWMAAGAFESDAALKPSVQKFLSSEYQYFSGTTFFDNELNELNNLVRDSWNCINGYVFSLFKAIAETQASILNREKSEVVKE